MTELEQLFLQARNAEAMGDLKTLDIIVARLSRHQHKMSQEDLHRYEKLQKSTDIVWK